MVYFELDLIWVEPYIIVPCCVKDVEYVLIIPFFTFAINERIICNSTQAVKLSGYIGHILLEHVHCRQVQMATFSICTLWVLEYDIIYGSYIVVGALSCSVQVTEVQAKANCSIWLSCNHSRVDPWLVFIVHLFKDICLPLALLGRHLAIGLGLASGGGVHRENARVGFYVV